MNMGTGGFPAIHDGGSVCAPGVVGTIISDCGYPYESSNALTNVLFNESEVLAAIVPTGGFPLASIQLFYNDEHALTLGVHQVVVNGVATDYPVSPLTANPGMPASESAISHSTSTCTRRCISAYSDSSGRSADTFDA